MGNICLLLNAGEVVTTLRRICDKEIYFYVCMCIELNYLVYVERAKAVNIEH